MKSRTKSLTDEGGEDAVERTFAEEKIHADRGGGNKGRKKHVDHGGGKSKLLGNQENEGKRGTETP